ncbi:MAG: hypothetical protein WBB67_02045 [bacterium]
MSWFKIHLTFEQVKNEVVLKIQNEFERLFTEHKGPEDAAMFDDLKPLTEGDTIYFSPGSTKFMMDIINQYLGEETEPPISSDVVLLVGHADAKKKLLK